MFTSDTFIYLVKINIAFVVFYLFYRLLFSRDTFFTIRRVCLLTILFLSVCYPLIPFTLGEEQKMAIQESVSRYATVFLPEVTVKPGETATQFTLADILCWGYGLVTSILLIRILLQIFSIFRLIGKGVRTLCCSIPVISLPDHVTPFSFFKWVFINPSLYESHDLREILTHEKTHVDQYHFIDVMISELLCALFWINPAVWLLKREIRRNLEFLADKKVVTSGFDRKAYQYHLLRLTCTSAAAQIVNKFNVTPLKKRIMMMNKKRTSKMGLFKYALLFPVVGLLILSSNVQAIVQMNASDMTVVKDSIVVKGITLDENNKPLKNVIVIIGNTNIGTFSNEKGEFSIKVKPGAELFFSHIGKKGQVRKVTDGQKLTVKMKDDVIQINEYYYSETTFSRDSTFGDDVFQVVEDMPSFPNGNINKYIATSIKYPQEAQKQKIQGRVTVQFVIEKDGSITEVRVLRSVDPLLDAEAIRVVKNMPKWKPGTQRGEPVRVSYTVPINFRLD